MALPPFLFWRREFPCRAILAMRSTHARHEFDEKAGGAMAEEDEESGSEESGGDGGRGLNPENGSADLLSRILDAIAKATNNDVDGIAKAILESCVKGQATGLKWVFEALTRAQAKKKEPEAHIQSLAEVLWKAIQEQDGGELAS